MLATTFACAESGGFFFDDGEIGVGQGGAQDFGQFRAILDAGELPGPDTLDDVGFFNEHKIDLPSPTCGADVCLHGELGVMGNMISGSNCTLVLIGLNTPVDPNTIPRLPLNLVITVDTSGSMAGEPIEYVREGLFRMLDDLQPEDRVSLVGFDATANVLIEATAGADPEFALAIGKLAANGATNIYDGLRRAYEIAEAHADPTLQNRVVLLSDGEATAGITSTPKLLQMAAAYGSAGFGLTTIGVGSEFDPVLMRELSEQGAGAFYFLEDPAAIVEVFEEEVRAFLVPLARDVVIDLSVDPGYALRAIYGTKQATVWGATNTGHIEIPSLQIAHRTTAGDDEQGRRGGGGAILAELVPRAPDLVAEPGTVGTLSMRYRVPDGDEAIVQEARILTPLTPGDTPERGHFSFAGVEKSFVMLNVFAGFEMAATRCSYGDYDGALGVLEPLAESVDAWVTANPDPDIDDDLRYIEKFIANLRAEGAGSPPPEQTRPNPWPRD